MSRRKRRTVTMTVVFEVHEAPNNRQIAAAVKRAISNLCVWPVVKNDPQGPVDGVYRLSVRVDKEMEP